jgi:hypothetical protein
MKERKKMKKILAVFLSLGFLAFASEALGYNEWPLNGTAAGTGSFGFSSIAASANAYATGFGRDSVESYASGDRFSLTLTWVSGTASANIAVEAMLYKNASPWTISARQSAVLAAGKSVTIVLSCTATEASGALGVALGYASNAGKSVTLKYTLTKLPKLTVVYPNKAVSLSAGSPIEIKWEKGPTISSVYIDLYEGGTFKGRITSSATGTSYFWTPGSKFPTGSYQLRITGGGVYDFSDKPFTLAGDVKIAIETPVAGTKVTKGTSAYVSWSARGMSGNVKIELFKGAVKVADIHTAFPPGNQGLGFIYWVPAASLVAGTDYSVLITEVRTGGVSAQSAKFTIQ